jgi:hypothetical protein
MEYMNQGELLRIEVFGLAGFGGLKIGWEARGWARACGRARLI